MIETELRQIIENMVTEMVQKDKPPMPHVTKNMNTEPIPENTKNSVSVSSCLYKEAGDHVSVKTWVKFLTHTR